MHILLAIWLLYLNLKNQTWRSFPQFSRSIIYVISFNGLYFFLCKDRLLWDFRSSYLKVKTVRRLQIFLITPLFILLFLSKYPKNLYNRILYICKWMGMSLLIESIALKRGAIIFKNGWNLNWSTIIYILMYVFSYLMSIKPLLTFTLSFAPTLFLLYHFQIPLPLIKKFKLK